MNLSRGWTALSVGLLLSLMFAPSARAHAAYESSDPGNQTTVSSPPSRVTAEFTEPVVEESRLDVYDPCGTQVDNGDSLVAADRITVSMSADKQGTYTVRFSVISAVDSHPTNGEFTFTSTGGEVCPGDEPVQEEPGSDGDQDGDSGNTGGGNSGGNGASTTDSSRAGSTGDSVSRGNDRSTSGGERRSEGGNAEAGKRESRARVRGTRLEAAAGDIGPTAISASDVANIWEGIPLVGFVIAMLVAGAIGGAGGLVYAGIMGPKR